MKNKYSNFSESLIHAWVAYPVLEKILRHRKEGSGASSDLITSVDKISEIKEVASLAIEKLTDYQVMSNDELDSIKQELALIIKELKNIASEYDSAVGQIEDVINNLSLIEVEVFEVGQECSPEINSALPEVVTIQEEIKKLSIEESEPDLVVDAFIDNSEVVGRLSIKNDDLNHKFDAIDKDRRSAESKYILSNLNKFESRHKNLPEKVRLIKYIRQNGVSVEESSQGGWDFVYISLTERPNEDVATAIKRLIPLGARVWPGENFLY